MIIRVFWKWTRNKDQTILKKEKNVPITLKYKGDSERDNKEMEGETIAKEPKTDQDNTKKDRQHKDETDTNPTDTLSTDIPVNRVPSRQRKAPKSLSKDFLWFSFSFISHSIDLVQMWN